MKVTLSVGGKFQAVDLALQLLKRDSLQSLITSYPKFEIGKYGIPKEKVKSVVMKEVLQRSWSKLPGPISRFWNPQFFLSELYDRQASKQLTPADIFTGWSGFSLHSIQVARQMGMKVVLEHGSSHIAFQTKILREEYEEFGQPSKDRVADPRIVEKELREYEACDAIAIPSSYVRRTFIENGVPAAKLIQVPYGVSLELFKQVPKEDNIFRIIFGGGLTLRKGVHYLLQAFAELKLPNAELLLIGPVTEEIKPFLKKYEGSYKRIDYRPLAKLHQYYSQGSVFVLPSIEEGLAMVQPQAMACGLPVIATTNTGGEDIIRDGEDGFIIPIRDVPALKDKILYLYEHADDRERMGRLRKGKGGLGIYLGRLRREGLCLPIRGYFPENRLPVKMVAHAAF
jgi:glycosyltransferase involved in cell wall biosynthesis